MNKMQNIKVGINLDNSGNIISILYNTTKSDIDLVLSITNEEYNKIQNQSINIKETLKELNNKYNNEIKLLLEKKDDAA